ncbi:MAG: phosphoesterase [bacterium]|nr:phosphoesterase [bacterium]
MTNLRTLAPVLLLAAALAMPAGAAVSRDPRPADLAFPRYQHVIVIVEENEGFSAIIGNANAPSFTALARDYGNATSFFAETHPSEPNYVAMIGGDTFGIQDDDAFYCKPGMSDPHCAGSERPGYVDHTIAGPNLASQLQQAGISWRGYFGAYDPTRPRAIFSGATASEPAALYASKHNPFLNFSGLRATLARHIAPLSRLERDLASGDLPAFAFVVPDQCDDMHGLRGPNVPADCRSANVQRRIARGDRVAKRLVGEIEASPIWRAAANAAIVITWDESDDSERAFGAQGCCGSGPSRRANQGGGRIPTIVITNHGPRHRIDATPYNHYALLRSIDDAFGIYAYPNGAADWRDGVRPMTPLFAVK